MKDIQIEGFKKTLDPVTVGYLEEKLETQTRVDLRRVTEKAANELRQLENEAAYDYLKIEKETKDLIGQIDFSDKILNNLEGLLKDFRQNLLVIKGEMTSLQEKSMQMNIGLNNRKNISNEFSEFIESIMLEPKLIEDILKGEINEEYVGNIAKLCKKLANLKRYNALDNKSVKEIEPELSKLKLKACERIKAYMNTQIANLKKPKTNIQIIQQNNLVNYRIFLFFLKEHHQETYLELSQNYSKLLSKVYAANFRLYIDDLQKLLDERHNLKYVIFPDNVSQYKNSSSFYIAEPRARILGELDEQLIIAHFESKNNKKFFLEQIFKSLDKLVAATIIQEFTFCQNFFCLTDEESIIFFATIFKQSTIMVLDRIRAWIAQTNDIYGLLLTGCILTNTKETLAQRKFVALDYYTSQIEMALWPRVNEVFDSILKEISVLNVRSMKQILDVVKEEEFLARAVNFLEGCAVIGKSLSESIYPLPGRLAKLVESLLTFAQKISKECVIEKDEFTVYINFLHIIVKGLKSAESLPQELFYGIESRLGETINKLVDKLLEEYFERIVRFLGMQKQGEITLKFVEETSRDFYENCKLKLANLKNEIEFRFKRAEVSSKIIKILVHKVLELYQEFCNFVKSVYPSYTSNLYPIHKLNVEIKSIMNN